MKIVCYLFFNGNCRQAMSFYAQALGGETTFSTYGDAPGCEESARELIMHARLTTGSAELMASDVTSAMPPATAGSNFTISVDCSSVEEQEGIFAALSTGGVVTMPLQDTFWGAHFGMLTDQFGMRWMFNCDKA